MPKLLARIKIQMIWGSRKDIEKLDRFGIVEDNKR